MTGNNGKNLIPKQFYDEFAQSSDMLLLVLEKIFNEKFDPILEKLNHIENEITGIRITLEKIDKRKGRVLKYT